MMEFKKAIGSVITKMNNQITLYSAPILIIIFLTFVVIFSGTTLTINIATKFSYLLIILMLTINQIGLYYIASNSSQYQIYMILTSMLINFLALYTLYIKRIYDEENKIKLDLKNKEIIEDTNVSC